MILFGVKGKNAWTFQPGRTQENIIVQRKREHSRKPDEQYDLIESCSWGPYLEMFDHGNRSGWFCWDNQSEDYYPDWKKYKNHSQKNKMNQNRNPGYEKQVVHQLKLLEKELKYDTK